MTKRSDLGSPRSSRITVVLLSMVASVILVTGILIRPDQPQPVSAPTEMDLALLTRLSQRRALDSTAQFFSTLADEGLRWTVSTDTREVHGVLWGSDLVVTPGVRGLPTTVVWSGRDGSVRARRVVAGPHLPIAAFARVDATAPDAAIAEAPKLISGEWIVAVWHGTEGRSFVPAVYAETHNQACNEETVETLRSTFPTGTTPAGAAVIDASGALIGMVATCGDRTVVLSRRGIDMLVERGRQLESQLIAEFGFRAQTPTLDEAAHLKVVRGALVREVWNGYPADAAGLRPGDVISGIDGEAVATPADLKPLLVGPGTSHSLDVRRASRSLTVVVNAGAASDPLDRSAGFVFESEPGGHRIERVVPGSVAFRAGLRSGDVVMRINQMEPRNVPALRRLLEARESASALVEIERQERRFVVLISQK